MLMYSSRPADAGEKMDVLWDKNHTSLAVEAAQPLSKRLEEGLSQGMQNLKQTLSDSDFEGHIESILSLKIADDSLMVVTKNMIHRSLLEHKFVPAFKEAFNVKNVRIISQK